MFLFTHSQEGRLQPAHLKTRSHHIHSGESVMKWRYELCACWWGYERDNVTNSIFHIAWRWNWWSFSKPDLELNTIHSFLPQPQFLLDKHRPLLHYLSSPPFSLKQNYNGKNNCSVVETRERWWKNRLVSRGALLGVAFSTMVPTIHLWCVSPAR